MSVLLTSSLISQNLYTGISYSPKIEEQENVFIQFEDTAMFVSMQVLYLTNFKEQRVQIKCGFRLMNYKGLQMYAYFPYLNGILGKGYNTPFCTEFRYKGFNLNLDYYQDGIIPTFRYRKLIYGKSLRRPIKTEY